jgi:hypothetical protein
MDAFETVIASILQRQGYWTLTRVKVELTKAEKRSIQIPSSPRWELDIVGYRGSTNEILVVECKSFLDSPGVECGAFDGTNAKAAKRYKLFWNARLCSVVLRGLQRQLVAGCFCAKRPSMKLCLAAQVRSVVMRLGYKLTSRRRDGSYGDLNSSDQNFGHFAMRVTRTALRRLSLSCFYEKQSVSRLRR